VATQHVPRFRALHAGGKPLLTALVCIPSTRRFTVILELYCLEEEEEGFDPPTLRVQAPYIGRGLVTVCCPATRLPVPPWLRPWHGSRFPSVPLPERMPLYKAPFPLDRHIWGICLWLCLGSFRGGGASSVRLVEAGRGCITPVSSLCRSC
jgi:hypothetical protein